MTYAQQELEAEYNGRIDYMREVYAATAADADLMGADDDGRADAEDNIKAMVAALLPTLSDDKVETLERWFSAQITVVDPVMPEDAKEDAQGWFFEP